MIAHAFEIKTSGFSICKVALFYFALFECMYCGFQFSMLSLQTSTFKSF